MKIELTDGTTIEIADKNIIKINNKVNNIAVEEYHGLAPDGRRFTITDRECIVHETWKNSMIFPGPLDLTELLKGHEGETFWSPCWGECELLEIHTRDGGRPSLKFRVRNGECRNVTPSGCLGYNYEGCGGECIIWPSKNHRTWEDFGKDIWAVKKESGELDLYLGHPKYGKLYTTTVGYYYLLYGKKVGVPHRII